jgi:hypothetical protein
MSSPLGRDEDLGVGDVRRCRPPREQNARRALEAGERQQDVGDYRQIGDLSCDDDRRAPLEVRMRGKAVL